MACCAQMDFYEASRLHLFHFTSIKLAEATVLCATSGPREVFLPYNWWSHKDAAPSLPWRHRKKSDGIQFFFFIRMSNKGKTNTINCRENGKNGKKSVLETHSHSHSVLVTAGGISVRGASLHFCRVNSFQMQEFPAGPAPSRCPVCQQICLKLGTFEQSFSSHPPEGELLLIKSFHLCIFDYDGWLQWRGWGGIMV